MSAELWLAAAALAAAALPALLVFWNLGLYRPPAPLAAGSAGSLPAVSVLIPARNEERGIAAAVAAVLASRDVRLELIVLDDGSDDGTYAIVDALAAADDRLRVERAPGLPPGWCGKQHACAVLAQLARHPVLVFLDADVRLAPDGLARSVALLERSGAGLLSGFPRQITGTWLERLLIPLIHFVLLGFLPIWGMRRSLLPGFGAGCGQLMITRADAYRRADGHRAIRASLHDGVRLPRAFRQAGIYTDLFDATEIARCRMYRNAVEVWQGLAKNATEGLAAPPLIVPFTLLLGAGQVLPPLLLLAGALGLIDAAATGLAALACGAVYAPRVAMARRFKQAPVGVIAHPLAVLLLLAVQWYALWRQLRGRAPAWKGRRYPQSLSR